MDSSGSTNWNVLCWNVRGLNSATRQRAVREEIDESQCSIICSQETKCPSIDANFIRSWCPRRFDQLAYTPSMGASGGLITVWNSSIFAGVLIESQQCGLIVQITSKLNVDVWTWSMCMVLEIN